MTGFSPVMHFWVYLSNGLEFSHGINCWLDHSDLVNEENKLCSSWKCFGCQLDPPVCKIPVIGIFRPYAELRQFFSDSYGTCSHGSVWRLWVLPTSNYMHCHHSTSFMIDTLLLWLPMYAKWPLWSICILLWFFSVFFERTSCSWPETMLIMFVLKSG